MSLARAIAFEMIRPTVACADIDAAVNDFLDGARFGDFRTRLHRYGHGFGLGNHEPPWIAVSSSQFLAANMLISIEPGIYASGVGGYRQSDTVLVTDQGHRCPKQLPTNLDALVIGKKTLRHRIASRLTRRGLGPAPAAAPI